MSSVDTDGDVRDEDVRSRASAPSIMTADPLAPREGTGTTAKQSGETETEAAPLALKKAVGPKSVNGEDDVRSVEHALGVTGHLDLKPTGGTTGLYGAPLQNGIKRLQAETGLKQDGLLRVGGPTARLIGGVLKALGADPAPKRSRTSKRLRTEQSSANARLVTHLKGTGADGLVPGLYARAFAENDDGKAETVDFIRQLQRADKTRAARVRASMEGSMTGPQRADLADWLDEADAESDPGAGIDPARRAAVLKAFAQKTSADAPKPPDDGKPDGKPDDGKPDDKPVEKPDEKPEKPKPNCNKRSIKVYEMSQAWNAAGRRQMDANARLAAAERALEEHRQNGLKADPPAPPNEYERRRPKLPPPPPKTGGGKRARSIALLWQFLASRNVAGGVGDAMTIEEARRRRRAYVETLKQLEAEVAAAEKEQEAAEKNFNAAVKEHAKAVAKLNACRAGQIGDGYD